MEIHGDECVYIFPDLHKAISGTYRRGSLVSGFTFDVVDFVVPDVGLPFPVLSAKKQGAAISRSESTAREDSLSRIYECECEWTVQKEEGKKTTRSFLYDGFLVY